MSELFRPRVSTVKGISDRRRLPRLGKIRLGVKVPLAGKNPNTCECKGRGCWKCTRPTETKHFVCPAEVRAIYGNEPTKINVMFLVNDPAVVFPQAMKYYGNSAGLKCTGDGEKAYEVNAAGEMQTKQCPCPLSEDHPDPNNPSKIIKAQCNLRASLLVTLPEVNMGGVYQIDVGSYNSIIDVNSGIDTCRALIQQSLGVDRFAMIPLTLERVPTETHHDGKKQTHYTLRLTPNLTLADIQKMQNKAIIAPQQYALPEPEEIRPDLDGPVVPEEAETKAIEQAPAPTDPDAAFAEIPSGDQKQEVQPTTQLPTVGKMRSMVALRWGELCDVAGILNPDVQDQLRHTWVEKNYGGKQGVSELTEDELRVLWGLLNDKHVKSPEKKAEIVEWLRANKPTK